MDDVMKDTAIDALRPTIPQLSKSVNDVFENVKARKSAILKALTTDIRRLFHRCDPEKDNMCLYGHPDGNWEVKTPSNTVPCHIPEPASGINFARDHMLRDEWVAMIADFSDAWLLEVASYIGNEYGFNRTERERLFDMINESPKISEVIHGTTTKQPQASSNFSSTKTMSNSKGRQAVEMIGETKCEGCEEYTVSHFWICCDLCDSWYHGKCVKITPTMARYIKQYICPPCNMKIYQLQVLL